MVAPLKTDDVNNHLGASVHQREQTLVLFAVTALTLVAAWLRLRQATESLWLDELHTAWTVDDGLPSIGRRARAGNYGPVYFVLPWLSTRLFGMREWSLRLPSLLAGIALVPTSYVVARNWFQSRTIGCLAAALFVTDPHAIFYSLDARPYALVQLIALFHVALLVRLLNARRRSFEYFAYWLLGVLLFQLHYTAALLFTGELVLVLFWYIQGGRNEVARAFLWTVAIGFGGLMSLSHVRQIADRRELWQQFIDRDASLGDVYPVTEYLGTALLALAICWILERIWNRAQPTITRPMRALVWCLIWLAVPLGLAYAMTRLDFARLLYRRYVMFSYAPLVLLSVGIGMLCASRPGRILYAMSVLVGLNLLLGPWWLLAHDGRSVHHSHEDWRAAVAELNAQLLHSITAEKPELVLMRPGLIEERMIRLPQDIERAEEYLLFPVSSIYRLPVEHDVHVLTSTVEVTERARRQLRSGDGCWLLIRGTEWFEATSTDLTSQLQRWMGGPSEIVLEKRRDFGNLVVVRCQTGGRIP